MPRWLPPVVVLAILLRLTDLAAAQAETPVGLPMTPDPSECRLEPRPPAVFEEAIREAIASPIPVAPMPSPTTPAIALPEGGGRPADAETVAAVVATMREALACNNARDYPRAYALYTDEAAHQSVASIAGTSSRPGPAAATPERHRRRRTPRWQRQCSRASRPPQSRCRGSSGEPWSPSGMSRFSSTGGSSPRPSSHFPLRKPQPGTSLSRKRGAS